MYPCEQRTFILISACLLSVASLSSSIANASTQTTTPLFKSIPILGDTTQEKDAINWTGYYLGANGGWGFSKYNTQTSPSGVAATADILPVNVTAKPNGALFGGQIGYNRMLNSQLVIGVEADLDGTGINAAQQATSVSQYSLSLDQLPNGLSNNAFAQVENTNLLTSIRGRIGTPWRSGLFYFTAGGAWRQMTRNMITTGNVASTSHWSQTANKTFTETLGGYIVGGGLEWQIAQHWLLRGEYLYYGVNGSKTFNDPFPNSTPSGSSLMATINDKGVNVVRCGLSYKI